jgi:hypothetical protein
MEYVDRSAHLQQCQQCQQLFMSIFEETTTEQSLQQDLLIGATLCTTPLRAGCGCSMHALIAEIDFSQLQTLHDTESDAT